MPPASRPSGTRQGLGRTRFSPASGPDIDETKAAGYNRILVVDGYSKGRTVEIARQRGRWSWGSMGKGQDGGGPGRDGGHVLFGAVAALPSLDSGLVMLASGESLLIDSVHLLAALGYPVEGRLAHSTFFALAAAAFADLRVQAQHGEVEGGLPDHPRGRSGPL